jgi:hypothetical protein
MSTTALVNVRAGIERARASHVSMAARQAVVDREDRG